MPIVSALETSSGQKVTANDSEPPIIDIWRMSADFELCDFNEIYRINAHNRKVPPPLVLQARSGTLLKTGNRLFVNSCQ